LVRLLHALIFLFAAPAVADVQVSAERNDDLLHIKASFTLPAGVQESWAVLVDYDHVPAYMPDVKSSRVLERKGNRLKVLQKGVARVGPFSFDVESVREVDLEPAKAIRTKLLSGNMKKMDTVTELVAEGEGTRVKYEATAIPDFWLPPLIGPYFIRSGMRDQIELIVTEVSRRKQAGAQPKSSCTTDCHKQ
jgi:carbon monoxide dehydrogenase subunit G